MLGNIAKNSIKNPSNWSRKAIGSGFLNLDSSNKINKARNPTVVPTLVPSAIRKHMDRGSAITPHDAEINLRPEYVSKRAFPTKNQRIPNKE
jgi:hypothetical protein